MQRPEDTLQKARLSGFLLVREIRDASFKKSEAAKESLTKNSESKMPVFVLAAIMHLANPVYADPVSVIFSGGLMLGAIFICFYFLCINFDATLSNF